MATSFPTSKDILINPDGLDSVKEVSHSAQHANANDAIEALETKVGVNNSTDGLLSFSDGFCSWFHLHVFL